LKESSGLEIRGVRCYSPNGRTTFQNPFYDVGRDKYVSVKDIGWLSVPGKPD